jgi:hypothetical protein
MGANALKGFGLGIATLGGEVGKGMMADTVERKRQESEARKEASLERRWRAELEASKAEREAGRTFEAGERDKDRTFRSGESEKDRKQRESEEAGRNSRTDRQLELAERRSLTAELSDVRQQVGTRLNALNMKAMQQMQKLQETKVGADLEKATAELESQYKQAFSQITELGQAQHQQVLNAYGDLGKQVAESMSYNQPEQDEMGLFSPTGGDTKDAGTGNPPPKSGTVDPVTGKVVEMPDTNFSFGGMFDIGMNVATGKMTRAEADAAAQARWNQPKSPVDYVAGPAGAIAGALTGLGKESTVGLWDWATTRK